jgi:HK97 gp10 family phage protein
MGVLMPKQGSIEALRARFAAIPEAVRDAVQPALVKSAEELQARMRLLAPKDTGALANSIAVTLPGESTPPYSQPGGSRTAGETEVIVTAGNSAVRYAHLQEYGTADAPARPFFWPAFRLTRKRIENRIKRAIAKAVKDEFAK